MKNNHTIKICNAYLLGILIMIFFTIKINAQNYLINFTGTGSATTFDSIIVTNLMQNTTKTLYTGDILHLGNIGINEINGNNELIKVYPNPMQSQAEISFYAKQAGNTQLTIYDISGRKVFQNNRNLMQGIQKYKLSKLKKGMYFIYVKGEGYLFTAKIISINSNQSEAVLEYLGYEKYENISNLKSTKATIDMPYTIGDRLLFKGVSGKYSTIVTDIPTSDKTITFNFIPCTDIDNNNYSVVQIGTQTWMAENLKTTTYQNGIHIPNITTDSTLYYLTYGAYCNFNYNANNALTYGHLYNFYAAIDTGKIAPYGWHVPSKAEWDVLVNFLGGLSIAGGKMKETGLSHWNLPNNSASNSTGFTALPAGYNDGFHFNALGNEARFWSTSLYTNGLYPYNSFLSTVDALIAIQTTLKSYSLSIRCIKDTVQSQVVIPSLATSPVTAVSFVSAVSGGNITADGGSSITARGVCWSTAINPTITDSKTTDSLGTGSYISSITGLTPNTTYYLRAYATNNAGTAYGNQITFTTLILPNGEFSDFDGNIYDTIHIGTQIWMKQNLKTTHFCNGDSIPNITINNSWTSLSLGAAYCNYNNNTNDAATYGRLYNFNAVTDARNLCPTGWHIPTDAELTALTNYLGGESIAGGKLKEVGTSHWQDPNIGATNESGFTALPAGNRSGQYGTFSLNGTYLYLWSSTISDTYNAWCRSMGNSNTIVSRGTTAKRSGLSVRCLKN